MITVFTPTYNRAALLGRLFDSLVRQTSRDFEWLIVDDGSTDATAETVEGFHARADFPITYIRQPNAGKHAAVNRGLSLAKGELFFCVDSDDWMASPNAIAGILKDWERGRNVSDCAGIVSYKNAGGKRMGDAFPAETAFVKPSDLVNKYASGGERNFIYRTEMAKAAPYPTFAGETFCPDAYLSDVLSAGYRMMLRPEEDVSCEYQEDGLSRHYGKLMYRNPKGFCAYFAQSLDLQYTVRQRVKVATRYWAFRLLGGRGSPRYTGRHRFLAAVCFFPGCAFRLYYGFRLKRR